MKAMSNHVFIPLEGALATEGLCNHFQSRAAYGIEAPLDVLLRPNAHKRAVGNLVDALQPFIARAPLHVHVGHSLISEGCGY